MNFNDLKKIVNDNIDKKTIELEQLKENAKHQFAHQADQFKEMKEKVADAIEIQVDNLKEKVEETVEKIKLEKIIPDIRQIIFERIGEHLNQKNFIGLSIDQILKIVFKTAYSFLPRPIQFIVKEDVFVDFCIKNKVKLLSHLPETASKERRNQPEEIITIDGLLKAGVLTTEEHREQKSKLAGSK